MFSLGSLGTSLKDKWIAESGVTAHMCNQIGWFKSIKLYDNPILASVGDGGKIEVLGMVEP